MVVGAFCVVGGDVGGGGGGGGFLRGGGLVHFVMLSSGSRFLSLVTAGFFLGILGVEGVGGMVVVVVWFVVDSVVVFGHIPSG